MKPISPVPLLEVMGSRFCQNSGHTKPHVCFLLSSSIPQPGRALSRSHFTDVGAEA